MHKVFNLLRKIKYYFFNSKKINIKKITSSINLKYKKTNLDNFLVNTLPLLSLIDLPKLYLVKN